MNVSAVDPSNELRKYMPILVSAATDYIGANTSGEKEAASPSFTPPSPGRSVFFLIVYLTALLCGGCQTYHDVTINAVSNPYTTLGQSYQLEIVDPSGHVEAELQAQAATTIRDSLAGRGLYEAPENATPDMIIKYEYGVGDGHIKIVNQRNTDLLLGPYAEPTTPLKAVMVYDKFIELTAREAGQEPDPARPRAPVKPSEELWNVRATIEDRQQVLAPFLPALASSCIDYIGENTGRELHFKVEADKAQALLKPRPPLPAE